MCSSIPRSPKSGEHMLKITKQTESAQLIRVNLYGRFTAEYVPEIEKALVPNGKRMTKFALDLHNVTFVDRPAMKFLRDAKSRKIKLENIPSYVMRWIEQEAHNAHSKD